MLSTLFAIASLVLAAAPARASEAQWTVTALNGAAFVQTDGPWLALRPHDPLPPGASVKTEALSSLVIARPGATLSVDAGAILRFAAAGSGSLTTLALETGRVGLDLHELMPSGFRLRMNGVNAIAMTGTFAAAADHDAILVLARRDSMRVSVPKADIAIDLQAGQAARYTPEEGLILSHIADNDSALALATFADKASGRTTEIAASHSRRTEDDLAPFALPQPLSADAAPHDRQTAQAQPSNSADPTAQAPQKEAYGPQSAGAMMSSMTKALPGATPDPNAADDDAASKPKAKIKAKTIIAAVEAVAADRAEVDVSDLGEVAQELAAAPPHKPPPPKKPAPTLMQMRLYHALTLMDASSAALVGVFLAMMISMVGAAANAILGSAGFGTWGNSALAFVGVAVGAAVRDVLFYSDFWYRLEPSVSIFLCVGFGLATLVAACFAKARVLARQELLDIQFLAKSVPTAPAMFNRAGNGGLAVKSTSH